MERVNFQADPRDSQIYIAPDDADLTVEGRLLGAPRPSVHRTSTRHSHPNCDASYVTSATSFHQLHGRGERGRRYLRMQMLGATFKPVKLSMYVDAVVWRSAWNTVTS